MSVTEDHALSLYIPGFECMTDSERSEFQELAGAAVMDEFGRFAVERGLFQRS